MMVRRRTSVFNMSFSKWRKESLIPSECPQLGPARLAEQRKEMIANDTYDSDANMMCIFNCGRPYGINMMCIFNCGRPYGLHPYLSGPSTTPMADQFGRRHAGSFVATSTLSSSMPHSTHTPHTSLAPRTFSFVPTRSVSELTGSSSNRGLVPSFRRKQNLSVSRAVRVPLLSSHSSLTSSSHLLTSPYYSSSQTHSVVTMVAKDRDLDVRSDIIEKERERACVSVERTFEKGREEIDIEVENEGEENMIVKAM